MNDTTMRFCRDSLLLEASFRRRLFVFCVATMAAPIYLYMAWRLFHQETPVPGLVLLGFVLFLVGATVCLWRGIGDELIPRLAIALAAVMTAYLTLFLGDGHMLFWLSLLPLAALMILGWKEGLVWSFATLMVACFVIWQLENLNPSLRDDFIAIFILITVMGWCAHWLRENASRIASDRIERLRAAEKARRESELALAQSRKLQAVGQLSSGVAHDLNNMLMVVRGNIEVDVAQRGQSERLDDASQAIDRAASLIDKLLAFSRRKTMNPEVIDVNGVIRSMRPLLERSLTEQVRLDVDLADDLWNSRVDALQFGNSLVNLAVNARQAIEGSGVVRLATRNARYSKGGVQAADGEEYVCIQVSDTGCGIPAELHGKVFEPFFTTRDSGVGSGLGLSTVHGFAGQSGGHILLDSEPGEGTTFTLLLPRADGAARENPVQIEEVTPELAGLSVLLLEDDPAVLVTVENMLEQLGCEVYSACDTRTAGKLLERSRPAVVLSDVVLAEDNTGVDFVGAARRRYPDLPALLMSGYAADVTGVKKLPEGTPLLLKPFTADELRAAVARVMPLPQ